MLPIVLLLAAVVGRWWIVPVAAIGWPIAVAGTGCSGLGCLSGAAALGAINAAAGVLVHKGAVWLFQRMRHGHAAR